MVNRDPERYKTVEGQNELRLWLYQQPFNAAREALFRLNTGASRSLKNPARIIEYLVLKHVKFERKFWASSLGIYLNDQAKSGSLHARSNGKLIRLALLQRPHEDNSTESIRYVIVAIARACRQDIKDPATVHDMKMSHMRWRLEYQVNHAIKCQFHEQCGGFLVCPKQCAGESQLSTRCVWRGQPICVDCSDRKEPERDEARRILLELLITWHGRNMRNVFCAYSGDSLVVFDSQGRAVRFKGHLDHRNPFCKVANICDLIQMGEFERVEAEARKLQPLTPQWHVIKTNAEIDSGIIALKRGINTFLKTQRTLKRLEMKDEDDEDDDGDEAEEPLVDDEEEAEDNDEDESAAKRQDAREIDSFMLLDSDGPELKQLRDTLYGLAAEHVESMERYIEACTRLALLQKFRPHATYPQMADDLLIANAPAPPAVLGPKQFLTQHSEQYRRQYNLADPACVNAEELSANVKLEAAPPAPKPADTTWVLPLVQEAQSKGKKRECSWCKNPMWQGKNARILCSECAYLEKQVVKSSKHCLADATAAKPLLQQLIESGTVKTTRLAWLGTGPDTAATTGAISAATPVHDTQTGQATATKKVKAPPQLSPDMRILLESRRAATGLTIDLKDFSKDKEVIYGTELTAETGEFQRMAKNMVLRRPKERHSCEICRAWTLLEDMHLTIPPFGLPVYKTCTFCHLVMEDLFRKAGWRQIDQYLVGQNDAEKRELWCKMIQKDKDINLIAMVRTALWYGKSTIDTDEQGGEGTEEAQETNGKAAGNGNTKRGKQQQVEQGDKKAKRQKTA